MAQNEFQARKCPVSYSVSNALVCALIRGGYQS
ncbi:hypothetical protein FHX11_000485 [Rhizobium sp. BK602]|nr:hypothetical protein [Rhizobium sp. BK602]